jgi:YidC/Oxa1 family membrane protein insertase
MERRFFLAIALSILVLYAYQIYFAPPPPAAPPASQKAPDKPPPPATAETAVSTPVEPAAPSAITAESSERQIVVDTRRAQVVFSNRGGRVLHWRLRDYLDGTDQPVDLVPSSLPERELRPFSLRVDDEALTARLNTALYRASADATGRIDAREKARELVFEFEDAAGIRVRKQFTFEPDSFVTTFSATVVQGDQSLNPWVIWGAGLGDVGAASAGGSFFTGNYVQPPAAIYHRDGEVVRLTADSLAAQPTHEGDFLFAGIDDHYFIATFVSLGRGRIEYRPLTVTAGAGQQRFVSMAARLDRGPSDMRLFAGAKEFEALRTVNPQLVYAINFGIFQWLVVPLLQALKWLYGFIGNYGWAIIILTVLINLVMFPLRHKSLVSMRKMQLIQPQVKAIQDRFAHLKVTDPARQKMNTEIMNLYREKGVNPAAGCVPMLLTMPVLFAFYSLLSQSIELRGAPFVFWIHDLSQKDPYYVTPLLMGATMFWQQWMMPTTADVTQQRVMLIMPVVFTVMFLGFPSGLAIYYLVSNLFQIGQQHFTNRTLGPPPAAAPRPAAERRQKTSAALRPASGGDKA